MGDEKWHLDTMTMNIPSVILPQLHCIAGAHEPRKAHTSKLLGTHVDNAKSASSYSECC